MKIELDLGNPNFTLLHRAGLAGLWMSLRQLGRETQVENRPGGLDWQCDRRRVILSWNGNDLEVMNWLLQESFQLKDGVICLRGLDSKTMDIQNQMILHQGILGTFLQHNKTHTKLGNEQKSFQLDEEHPPLVVQYKSLSGYVYQEFAKNLCDREGNLSKEPLKVPGWLNPGAVVRHTAFSGQTSFEEPPEFALVLLFACVGCCYYILRSQLRDKRAQYALVIPEVRDLETYAKYRQQSKLRLQGYQDFYACGLGDAGLRFLTAETTINITETYGVSSCQVVTLGTVSWSAQQKTRTDLYLVKADDEICQVYQDCQSYFRDRIVKGKNDTSFIARSFAREIITENLVKSQPWYLGLSDYVNSNESFQKLTYEREGLYKMVQKLKPETKRLFVQACHECLYFTYGKARGKFKDKKNNELTLEEKKIIESNINRENVKIRTSLTRCRNAESFREFMVKFWARAGNIPTLREHWNEFIDMMTGQANWKETRDLALLALASYKRPQIFQQNDNDENQEDIPEYDPPDILDL
ncbi:type I-MYXAN CRISPR-associated Cas8a1/Cmx1 [Planktothricoides raciborskii]|uniref:Type I-MYXAN CRISPR-associated Cas8a1/Cmx1 n=1 Tax=Planktothricoides raciborskii GIHE-MW2 TaxID=2792601 RepID=A0AAU8JMM6_9CYAN